MFIGMVNAVIYEACLDVLMIRTPPDIPKLNGYFALQLVPLWSSALLSKLAVFIMLLYKFICVSSAFILSN